MSFKLILLNVKGISNFKKRRTIFTWSRKRNADKTFLQEAHSTLETIVRWKNEWGGELIACHGGSNSRDCKVQHTILDPMGRYLILKADIKDSRYVLINVYAPNKDKDQIEFVKNLLVILRKENLDTEEKVIMGGDFNCPLNPAYDKKGGNRNQRCGMH